MDRPPDIIVIGDAEPLSDAAISAMARLLAAMADDGDQPSDGGGKLK